MASTPVKCCSSTSCQCTPLQGVLSMSWSGHDAGLLLSSAKDHRTLLWDVASGEVLGEVPAGDSWDFVVAWSPSNPGVFATSSYGAGEGSSGKVCMADVQPCRQPEACTAAHGTTLHVRLTAQFSACLQCRSLHCAHAYLASKACAILVTDIRRQHVSMCIVLCFYHHPLDCVDSCVDSAGQNC